MKGPKRALHIVLPFLLVLVAPVAALAEQPEAARAAARAVIEEF